MSCECCWPVRGGGATSLARTLRFAEGGGGAETSAEAGAIGAAPNRARTPGPTSASGAYLRGMSDDESDLLGERERQLDATASSELAALAPPMRRAGPWRT